MSTSSAVHSPKTHLTIDYSQPTGKSGPAYILSSETQAELIPNGIKINEILRNHKLQISVANVSKLLLLTSKQYTPPPSLETLLNNNGFKQTEWRSDYSFEKLMEELGDCKCLYAHGYFAKENYKKLSPATKFHEKQVIFLNKFDANPLLDVSQLKKQTVVIVGTIEGTDSGIVLYIEPSKGDENPNIYGIEYEEFCKYILPINQENQGFNGCCLLKSEQPTKGPSTPSTPRKALTPRTLTAPHSLKLSKPTTKIQSVVFKTCDLKPHHISALRLLLNQYDQNAQDNASALNTGFKKYWEMEDKIKKNSEYLTRLISFLKKNNEVPFDQQIKSYFSLYKPSKSIADFLQDCSKFRKDPQLELDTTVKSWRLENLINLIVDLGCYTDSLHKERQNLSPEQALLKLEEHLSYALMVDFGFKIVPFKPSTSFADFKKQVIEHKYLYAFGYFVKNNWVSDPKTQTLQDKEVVCLEGDTITNKQFSSIVIIGYVDSEKSILFINPENKSTNKTIYKLDYTTFCDLVRPITDDADFESDSYLLKYQGS